jgi:hypothetical protein
MDLFWAYRLINRKRQAEDEGDFSRRIATIGTRLKVTTEYYNY